MRWDNPWEELRRLQEEMDHAFDSFFSPRRRRLPARPQEKEGWLIPYSEPPADVIDKGKEFKVIVDLPGVSKKDIDVTVRDKAVEIKAEKKDEKTEEREGYFFQERKYQGYERRIALPEDVVPNKTSAEYNNGVLELTIKKAHPSEVKEFKVKFD
ncbi:MAG: Hsp20/alpha crystallin family protein [Candidatus Methanofastidiosia archaeon]